MIAANFVLYSAPLVLDAHKSDDEQMKPETPGKKSLARSSCSIKQKLANPGLNAFNPYGISEAYTDPKLTPIASLLTLEQKELTA